MKKELLEYCYKNEKNYVAEEGQVAFDDLITIIECGYVNTFEELAEYGMQYEK